MTPELVGIIGIIVLVILLFARMAIGFAMAFTGFLGFAYLGGIGPALGVLAEVPYRTMADYIISVVPVFVFMGVIVSNTRISEDLYYTGYKWVGQARGGLAIATIFACAAFAAICGHSGAETVTIGKVAVPEMKKYNYDSALASGCVAGGGTLGILIPPSLAFIFYALLTEQSVGELFMAGILPGILLAALFTLTIVIITSRNPQAAPPGPKTSFREKITSLRYTWATLALFLLIMGGIYMGIFTPTEAGAIGAFGAIVIGVAARRLSRKNFVASVMETVQLTAMIAVLIIGAYIFMNFLAISKLPFKLASVVSGLGLPRYAVWAVIVFVYVILGMFLDIIGAIILSVPIILPTVLALGFDPIWFGVIAVILIEMGLITPPVGLNAFMLAGVIDIPISTIFRGIWPFVGAMLVCIAILTAFPQIALFIPGIM